MSTTDYPLDMFKSDFNHSFIFGVKGFIYYLSKHHRLCICGYSISIQSLHINFTSLSLLVMFLFPKYCKNKITSQR